MAEPGKKFDPRAKAGQFNANRIADAVRRRAGRAVESKIQTGREKVQGLGQQAESRLREFTGGGDQEESGEDESPSGKGDYSARLRSLRQGNLRDASPEYAKLRGGLDTFERENPEFSKYARKKILQAQEDGDYKKTAEGIAKDAEGLRDVIEAKSLLGKTKLYIKAFEYGWKVAAKLDKNIKKGGQAWWIVVVVVAVLKDVFDMLITFLSIPPLPTALFGPTTDTIISILFFAFFLRFLWGKGTFIFRMILKRIGPSFLIEAIPGMAFIPFFTITILYAWWKTNKIQKQLRTARAKLGKELGDLEKNKPKMMGKKMSSY